VKDQSNSSSSSSDKDFTQKIRPPEEEKHINEFHQNDNFEMIENPQFLYEGSLSSEDEELDPNKRNNFDFNLAGFKDEFLGSSSDEE